MATPPDRLDVVSDWAIALSYFAIPVELLWFFWRFRLSRPSADLMLVLFVLFITLCGMTHLANALMWVSLNHVCKALTAIVSFSTAVVLVWVIPKVLSLPGQLADMDDDLAFESNLRVFNQTIVLCTRNLTNVHMFKLAAETLKYMFPGSRLAIVERDVQLRHGLHELDIGYNHVLLVDQPLFDQHTRFFEEVAHQIFNQHTEI